MLKWDQLQIITTKTLISAIIAITLLPMAADWMKKLGFDYSHLVFPILGGFLYMLSYGLFKYTCPKEIIDMPNESTYLTWAIDNNINIFSELNEVFSLKEKEILELIGKESHLYYPPEKGLAYSRCDCINVYSKINYSLIKTKKIYQRIIISIGVFVSLIMINWLSIERIIRIFGESS